MADTSVPQWQQDIDRHLALRDAPKCSRMTRSKTPCQRPAGWGTDHPGEGACKLHGGSRNPISPHLLTSYLNPLLAPLVQGMLDEEPDLMNCRFELAVMKAKFRELQGRPVMTVDEEGETHYDLDLARHLRNYARDIVSMTEKIQQLETGRHHYLHITVTGHIIQAFAEIGRRFISDPRQRDQFSREVEEAIRRNLNQTTSRAIAAQALNPLFKAVILEE